MPYPALPTRVDAPDYALVIDPLDIQCDDMFVLDGYVYRACSDARGFGKTMVAISAVRQNDQMPSGWEICDVLERFDSIFYEG